MRGRKPKNPHLQLIDGRTHHGSKEEMAPAIFVDGELGPPPPWFTPEHVLKWEHALRFAPAGMLTELDRQVMTTFCIYSVIFDQSQQELIRTGGPVVASPVKAVPMQNPNLHTMNQAVVILYKCVYKLGFSPQSRTRVKQPNAKKRPGNAFANLKRFTMEDKRSR
jgi:P27 family predicted phage terminase small subunit